MPPRSILKCQPKPASHLQPPGHVHFPPSPQLSSIFYAHSAYYYDRSAIVVGPNDCALPQRNCPERTYVLSERRGEPRLLKQEEPSSMQYQPEEGEDEDITPSATYAHPGTDYFTQPFPLSSSQVPDLTWSESEDSDGILSPPTDKESYQGVLSTPTGFSRKPALLPSHERSQSSLSFLPHAPPPPHQRKRSLSPRNRERKARTYSSSDSDAPLIPSSSTRRRYLSTFTPDVTPDYGCLGGF